MHDIDGKDERVIAGGLVDGAAFVFEGIGDLFGRAREGALREEFGHEARDTAILWRLGEVARAESRRDGDEREAFILADEDAEAIGQLHFLDRRLRGACRSIVLLGERADGVEGSDGDF